jgi:hypothetical protein
MVLHMSRVQILLSEEQVLTLRRKSAATGRPVAALVREAVDAWIAKDETQVGVERALAAIGGFHSGLGDLAENHDLYLDDLPPR